MTGLNLILAAVIIGDEDAEGGEKVEVNVVAVVAVASDEDKTDDGLADGSKDDGDDDVRDKIIEEDIMLMEVSLAVRFVAVLVVMACCVLSTANRIALF